MRNLEIKYSKQALKFLKKQDTITQKRILNAISVLPKGDVKALQGKDGYRLRIGDYRVIFNNIDNIIFIRMSNSTYISREYGIRTHNLKCIRLLR